MVDRQNGRPAWQHLAGIGTLTLTAIAMAGAVVQIQFSSSRELMEKQFAAQNNAIKELRQSSKDDAIRLALELARREADSTTLREFKQFSDRVTAELGFIKDQLKVLEQTRPTTGELSGISKSVGEQVQRMEERIRQIEQNALRALKP